MPANSGEPGPETFDQPIHRKPMREPVGGNAGRAIRRFTRSARLLLYQKRTVHRRDGAAYHLPTLAHRRIQDQRRSPLAEGIRNNYARYCPGNHLNSTKNT